MSRYFQNILCAAFQSPNCEARLVGREFCTRPCFAGYAIGDGVAENCNAAVVGYLPFQLDAVACGELNNQRGWIWRLQSQHRVVNFIFAKKVFSRTRVVAGQARFDAMNLEMAIVGDFIKGAEGHGPIPGNPPCSWCRVADSCQNEKQLLLMALNICRARRWGLGHSIVSTTHYISIRINLRPTLLNSRHVFFE